jgi:hypothetical protein
MFRFPVRLIKRSSEIRSEIGAGVGTRSLPKFPVKTRDSDARCPTLFRYRLGYGCGFCSRPYSPFRPNQKPVSAKPMPKRATKFFTGL